MIVTSHRGQVECRSACWGLWLCWVAVLGACAPGPKVPKGLDLPELRRWAERSPERASVQVALAEAEMFAPAGEPERVAEQLARARALVSGDGHLWLLSALHADAHGEPDQALTFLERALPLLADTAREDAGTQGAVAAFEAEFAVYALAGLEGSVPGYRERVAALLAAQVERLPFEARTTARDLQARLALRAGDAAQLAAVAQAAGCITRMRVAGPFGHRELLGFDEGFGVDVGTPLLDTYALGPRRGDQDTRAVASLGCSVNLGGGPLGIGGTRFAQAELQVVQSGQQLLRVDSPNSFEVFVDGESRLRVDRRKAAVAQVHLLPIDLTAGSHLLTIKLTSRHPNPVLSFASVPWDGSAAATLNAENLVADTPYLHFLRAAVQQIRGDWVGARMTLKAVDQAEQVSPYLWVQRAAVALNDPLLPGDKAKDQSTQWLNRAVERDKNLWSPLLQLATGMISNGRVPEGILALQGLAKRFNQMPAIGLTLAKVLRSQGLDEPAYTELTRLTRRLPGACSPRNALLSLLLEQQRHVEAAQVVDELMTCDARSRARLQQLVRQRKWQLAEQELNRLHELQSPQSFYEYRLTALDLATQRGDIATRRAQLQALAVALPRSERVVLEELNLLAEEGQSAAALEQLNAAFAAHPADMGAFWTLWPALGGAAPLTEYRRDGLAAIEAYERSGHSYQEPQVLVFDYMALALFADGSSSELVHTIQRPQSAEAVDALAEVSMPEDAQPLTLRVIKADGRVLEPDAVPGKDTISMPNVEVGDYVEVEFLRHVPPQDGFPAGYLGDRFYFRSFEIPFEHSEFVVIAPAGVQLEVDPRGQAPTAVRRELDGRVEYRFMAQQQASLSQEPNSVSAVEYIPSVRVGFGVSWEHYVDTMRDMLSGLDVRDPYLADQVQTLLADVPAEDTQAKVRRLYDYVLEEVESESNDLFTQAATMLYRRSGNRARVLRYLLSLADIPAELVVVRSAATDQTEGGLIDDDAYEHLLVRVGDGAGQLQWLFTASRQAPFGYLPSLLTGQPALVLAEGAPRATTPEAQAGAELRSFDVHITLAEDGAGKVEVKERIRGSGAVSWRSELERIAAADLSRRFEGEYINRLFPGAKLLHLEVQGLEQKRGPIVLAYALEVEGLARKTGARWAVPALFESQLAAAHARVPSRETTAFTGAMVETEVVLHVHAPEGARFLPPAGDVEESLGDTRARFTRTVVENEQGVTLRRTFKLPTLRIAPEAYPDFVQFCRRVDGAEALELEYVF